MLKSQKINNDIFKKRKNSKIFFVLIVFILYFFSSIISGFKNTAAFLSIPSGIIWLSQKFIPTSESLQYLPIIFKTAIETILLAVSALFLALIGSEATGINLFTKVLVKIIASFFRNIPLVAWSLVLLFSFKQSQFTGFLALFLVTLGYLTRTFIETIDEASENIIEALKTTGASYFQIIFQGVIPSVLPQLISWLLFFIENGIREATLIGLLTGTGIGFIFNLYYRSFRYDAAGMVILFVIIIIISIELLSNKIRKELM